MYDRIHVPSIDYTQKIGKTLPGVRRLNPRPVECRKSPLPYKSKAQRLRVFRGVRNTSLRESFGSETARIASAAGSAVSIGVVATRGERIVHPERFAQLNCLSLAEVLERRTYCHPSLPRDGSRGCQIGQCLKGRYVLWTAIGV